MSLTSSNKAVSLIPVCPGTPPPVSQDLWTETSDKKTRTALRAVSDEILYKASAAIKFALPRKIVELTDLIDRSENDESSIFHSKWDTRWSSCAGQASSVTTEISVVGVSSINEGGFNGSPPTTTTRRFSISQQCRPSDVALPPSVSAFRPPVHILQRWEVLDSQCRQLVELLDLVQMYLLLKTPVAEEGNNTGVEIQQQCARTLADARRFIVGCESYLKMYHTQRAKLASKCLKYPQLEDYQRALVERDHEESRDCRYLLTRLRVQSIAVVDILQKNFEKVDDPKGLNRGGGTVGMY